MLLSLLDPRIATTAPFLTGPAEAVRLERFPRAAVDALQGQIGPLANLRSSAGCAAHVVTDSPWLDVHLARLRHHQLVPQGIALEVAHPAGVLVGESADLRERDGDVVVRLATGLRPGEVHRCTVHLPIISTCAIAGLGLADGAQIEPAAPIAPRWLAIGDSLTQGFSVQSPLATWVARLERRLDMPAWNLGVGGIRIEPGAFAWALESRRWELVTIALGSNHGWRQSEADAAPELAARLAELALAGGHGRVVWILPPWKPMEEGKGPPEFAGIPLDRETGARIGRVRLALAERLAAYAPRLEVVGDLLPHDHRYYPDGLHPFAVGFAKYADALARHLE